MRIFNIKNLNLPIWFLLICLSVIAFSVFARAEGIGYSNFQGDEVNTVDFLYEMNDGVLNYLLAQKRGPIQYIINILNVSLFGYKNEFLIRFPYAVFGTLALVTFYLVARKIYDDKTAFITSTLLAINGLFIAFARITQYQALMYFVVPIGALVFIKSIDKKNYRLGILSGLIMSFSFLTHYDTLSVVPFFVAIYLSLLVEKHRFAFKHAVLFFLAFFVPAMLYYVPFYLGQSFEETTSSYLGNRLFGGGFMPRTEITLKLITMYIPKFHIHMLFVLAIFSILSYAKYFKENSLLLVGKLLKKELVYQIYIFLVLLVLFSSIFSLYPIKPRSSSLLVIGASVAIGTLLILNQKVKYYKKAIIIWFLGAYSFYFFVMKDPRTHVYVSFIPLFFLAADGFIKFLNLIRQKALYNLMLVAFIIVLLFVSGVNYVIFIDKNPEYPWWGKSFLNWPIYQIKRVRHEKIEGVFGFNNYRGWEMIAGLFNKGCLVGNFKSNEKDSITYFYTRRHQVPIDSNYAVTNQVDNVIIIEGPHSWIYVTPKEPDDFVLLKTINSNDYPVTYIYGRISVYTDKKLKCDESVLEID